jgi:hypothetical protein
MSYQIGDLVDFSYSSEYGGGAWKIVDISVRDGSTEYRISNGDYVFDHVGEYLIFPLEQNST